MDHQRPFGYPASNQGANSYHIQIFFYSLSDYSPVTFVFMFRCPFSSSLISFPICVMTESVVLSLEATRRASLALFAASLQWFRSVGQRSLRSSSCLQEQTGTFFGLRPFLRPVEKPLFSLFWATGLLFMFLGALAMSCFLSHASMLIGICEHSLL